MLNGSAEVVEGMGDGENLELVFGILGIDTSVDAARRLWVDVTRAPRFVGGRTRSLSLAVRCCFTKWVGYLVNANSRRMSS